MMEWIDKDGKSHKIEEMELNHLINAMKFAQNRVNSLNADIEGISAGLVSYDNKSVMRIKYLRESIKSFKVELRERRLNQLLSKGEIDELDNIGLDL